MKESFNPPKEFMTLFMSTTPHTSTKPIMSTWSLDYSFLLGTTEFQEDCRTQYMDCVDPTDVVQVCDLASSWSGSWGSNTEKQGEWLLDHLATSPALETAALRLSYAASLSVSSLHMKNLFSWESKTWGLNLD